MENTITASATPAQLSDSAANPARWLILAEVAGFVALALFSRYLMSLYFWRYAGPVSLLMIVGLITVWMRARGVGWRDMGLPRLPGIKAKLMVLPKTLLVFGAFAAAVALTTVALPALGFEFMNEIPAGVDDRWGAVAGNLPLFLLWLGIVWTAAAFGEEMFFRGYLITRLETAFAGIPWGTLLAVLIPALIFGYGHFYYQGLRGLIVTGAIGFAFGAMFIVFKRSLWPMILLHGIIDTLGFVALYMGWE